VVKGKDGNKKWQLRKGQLKIGQWESWATKKYVIGKKATSNYTCITAEKTATGNLSN